MRISDVSSRWCYLDVYLCFVFKQKTAYEVRISDWSSDVCSSDLTGAGVRRRERNLRGGGRSRGLDGGFEDTQPSHWRCADRPANPGCLAQLDEIGRAPCRERVCQYV